MMDRRGEASGPLACFARGFGEELAGLGYDKRRANVHVDLLADLSEWLTSEGLAATELTEPRVAQFLGVRRDRGRRDLVTARGASVLLGYLRSLGRRPAGRASVTRWAGCHDAGTVSRLPDR